MQASRDHFDFKSVVSERRLIGLWRMLHGHRLAYVGAMVGVGLGAALKAGNYLLLRTFVDDVLASERFNVLPLIGLGFVGLALLQGLFTFASGRWAARAAESVARRLRNYLFDHVQRLSFTYHDHMQTGELLQRATSDVDAVRRFYADQAIGMGNIVLMFAVNVVALLNLHTTLALVSVVVAIPILIVSVFFFRGISKAYDAFQDQEARLSTVLQENLTGVRVVEAFAR
jgi:ATP-binding cassette subfamily B protein